MNTYEEAKTAARKLSDNKISQGYKPEGLYVWENLNGDTLFYRIRLKNFTLNEKWIRPMHYNGNSFVFGQPKLDSLPPPYGISHVIQKPHETVWIVEGENKVDRLKKINILAVTSGGANTYDKVDWKPLSHKKIVIWRDNDTPGLEYAIKITETLLDLQCEVNWVDVCKLNLPVGGDCIDWLDLNPSFNESDIRKFLISPNKETEFKSSSQHVHIDNWESPVLFNESNSQNLPCEVLPQPFKDFAFELSNSTETPEGLSVMAILGVLSAALAKNFLISPKTGWNEPINIYSIIALPPANNKSLVLNACTKPIVAWEKDQADLLRVQLKRDISERKTLEKRIESMRSKAAKEKDVFVRDKLESEISDLECNLTEPIFLPKIFINDVTPETLATQISEQGGTLGIFSDEGGIVETISGLYSNGNANIDVILKGIDGGHLRVRRKDKSFDLNPYLTILLTVQPVILEKLASKKTFTGNGMLERFLYLIPDSKLGFRTHNKPPLSQSTEDAYHSRVYSILKSLRDEVLDSPYVLKLDKDALKLWTNFQADNEIELRPNGRMETCLGWGGKICGFTLRIAGILHVAENGIGNLTINEPTMSNAVKVAKILSSHAIRAYENMQINETHRLARKMLAWIVFHNKESFTKSELTIAMKHHGNADTRLEAINELIERSIISNPKKLDTRKPTNVYSVNPLLFKMSDKEEKGEKGKL